MSHACFFVGGGDMIILNCCYSLFGIDSNTVKSSSTLELFLNWSDSNPSFSIVYLIYRSLVSLQVFLVL